jgi:hypothetical protein
MVWNLLGMGIKTGFQIYKNKNETKKLESLAEMKHMERMANGQIEYKKAVMENNQQGWKDEFVLVIVSLPLLVLGYAVFFGDDDIKGKLDMFFNYFNELPQWYQWLLIGIFGAIYGLKPGLDMFKKK